MNKRVSKEDEHKYVLYTLLSNTIDHLGADTIKTKRIPTMHAYWGVEPYDVPHIGCLIPLLKIHDCMSLKIKSTILLADVHASLNNGVYNQEVITNRVHFYKFLFANILCKFNANNRNVKFALGSDIQLSKSYVMDLFMLTKIVNIEDAKKLCHNVVLPQHEQKVSSLVYPLMQIVDEAILDANIQIGSVNHKEIYTFTQGIELKQKMYLMHAVIPKEESVHFMDDLECIKEKCNKMRLETCMLIIKHIVYPIKGVFNTYTKFDEFIMVYNENGINEVELRNELANVIHSIVSPIRSLILENYILYKNAYD